MSHNPGTFILRCDASTAMGTGHVMRCLALAQAWQDSGGRAVFAMAEAPPGLRGRLLAENMEVVEVGTAPGSKADARHVADLARQRAGGWVVVDGYHFGARYQQQLKAAGLKVLFVDDNGHAGHYSSDVVLNQNAHADERFYTSRQPYTRLLLGPCYAMLRREFAAWREWKREIPPIGNKVLVTMGGSDPDNVTERVIEAILSEPELTATVVVGGSNPHLPKLRAVACRAGRALQLVEDATNMSELMARADIAVAGAGTTSWEMCFLGLPALLIVLADNQRPASTELSARGVAIPLGEAAEIGARALTQRLLEIVASQQLRKSMSERGRELVDGQGAVRVVQALRYDGVRLRRATRSDCKLLWELANDPTVRASSFSPEPIPWDLHVSWFESKMATENCHIVIGEDDGTVVGQVRIDLRHDREGEIDISVAREFRGQGMGSLLITLAVRELFASSVLSRVHAYVLLDNTASQRAFENAGFRNVGEDRVKGQPALHYVKEKPQPSIALDVGSELQ